MSYILDALKKAERERHLAKIPTLETVHRASWDRRRPLWLWIGAAVVLANTALLTWLLRPVPAPERLADSLAPPAASAPAAMPGPPAPTLPTDRPIPASPPEKSALAATAPAEPAPASHQAAAQRQPQSEPNAETTTKRVEARPGPSAALAPAAPRVEPTKPRAADASTSAAPPAASEKPTVSTPTERPQAVAAAPDKPAIPPVAATPPKPVERSTGPLPALQEMAPADQEAMPKMSLQVLVYSDVPAERMVFINNQKYVEGQSIEGKVLVEGILPDGAVLSYQGKRFTLRR